MINYQLKVHPSHEDGKTYLWGGPDVKPKPNFPALLTVRVDEFGESIKLFSWDRQPPDDGSDGKLLGTLHKQQIYTFSLEGIFAVYAKVVTPKVDCTVDCTLVFPDKS